MEYFELIVRHAQNGYILRVVSKYKKQPESIVEYIFEDPDDLKDKIHSVSSKILLEEKYNAS